MISIDTIMSTDLITIAPEDNLATARKIMTERRIHHLPVVDKENGLVGNSGAKWRRINSRNIAVFFLP